MKLLMHKLYFANLKVLFLLTNVSQIGRNVAFFSVCHDLRLTTFHLRDDKL